MSAYKGLAPSIQKTIEAFAALPGVGPKTASRLTYYLLRAPDELSANLAQALGDLKTKTRFCSTCFNLTEDDPCAICADSQRDRAQLMVVEEPLDLMAMERTGIYRGRYHVLHGAIRPIEGIGPNELKIPQLLARLQSEPILELIIATNPSTEGEATAHTIQRYLEGVSVKITRLARGLPTGGDLEHVDALTLIKALQGRSSLS